MHHQRRFHSRLRLPRAVQEVSATRAPNSSPAESGAFSCRPLGTPPGGSEPNSRARIGMVARRLERPSPSAAPFNLAPLSGAFLYRGSAPLCYVSTTLICEAAFPPHPPVTPGTLRPRLSLPCFSRGLPPPSIHQHGADHFGPRCAT